MRVGDVSVQLYEAPSSEESVGLFPISNTPLGAGMITRGVCSLPKQACDALSCEVLRLLVSSAGCIIPVSCKVPRNGA